jgi:hypothetical protein
MTSIPSIQTCDQRTLDALRELAAHPKCVAIGECGLDFNRNFSPQDVQLMWFEEQVNIIFSVEAFRHAPHLPRTCRTWSGFIGKRTEYATFHGARLSVDGLLALFTICLSTLSSSSQHCRDASAQFFEVIRCIIGSIIPSLVSLSP